MRPFRKGDVFRGNREGLVVTVIWVDPENHFHAMIDFKETGVLAAEFLNHWTLIKEGPEKAA